MTRKYSSTSVQTTLGIALSPSSVSMTVASGTGAALLGGISLSVSGTDQFALAVDPDTVNEEIIFATQVSTDTFVIQRGRAGSAAVSHSAGATVKHVLTGEDLTYFNNNLPASILTTKGDLLATGTSGAVSRFAAGIDGQQLVADSTQTYGIRWATVNALPTQTGNSGKYLTTDGSNASWGTLGQETPHPFILMGA